MRKKLLILFCGILTVALLCSNVLIASATSLADSKVKATCKVTVVQKVVSFKASAIYFAGAFSRHRKLFCFVPENMRESSEKTI